MKLTKKIEKIIFNFLIFIVSKKINLARKIVFINTSSSKVDVRFNKFAPIISNLIDKKTLTMYNKTMKTKNQQQQNI